MNLIDEFEFGKDLACKNCLFWDAVPNTLEGLCRFNAPVIDEMGIGWPEAGNGDWCGSFQPSKEFKKKIIHNLEVGEDHSKCDPKKCTFIENLYGSFKGKPN